MHSAQISKLEKRSHVGESIKACDLTLWTVDGAAVSKPGALNYVRFETKKFKTELLIDVYVFVGNSKCVQQCGSARFCFRAWNSRPRPGCFLQPIPREDVFRWFLYRIRD